MPGNQAARHSAPERTSLKERDLEDRARFENEGGRRPDEPEVRLLTETPAPPNDEDDRGENGDGSWHQRVDRSGIRSSENAAESELRQYLKAASIDDSRITVRVAGETVTLTGSVSDERTRRFVEEIAASCDGVKYVENALVIASGAAREKSSTPQ